MIDSDILAPMRVAGWESRNRVWLAPMTNLQSHPDGRLGDDELAWLASRAAGGFGVVETCATHVSRDGQGWEGELGVFDDALTDDWRRLVDACHGHGARVVAQLFHGGARALARVRPWSAVASDGVRAGTVADIEGVIDAFAAAAARVAAAGGDGIELHAAHGYLLCQFLMPENVRDDGWGGSFEGRSRLLLEVVRAVRASTPAGFAVGVRVSPERWGVSAEGEARLDLDESVALAGTLAAAGVDFVHVSLWDVFAPAIKRPEPNVLGLYRRALGPDVPLVAAGNLWTAEDAECALALGADAVALGRSAIVNAAWPVDVGAARREPVRPPVTFAALRAAGLGESFAAYMRRWSGFVREEG